MGGEVGSDPAAHDTAGGGSGDDEWERHPPLSIERAFGDRTYLAEKTEHVIVRLREEGPPTVVYAMGKSGTTAVARALRRAGVPNVSQVHNLRTMILEGVEREYVAGDPSARPHHIWDAQALLFRPASPERPWTVISTVRDPIAIAVAAFFQAAERRGHLGPDATVASLADAFGGAWDGPLDWFDVQMRKVLGIDVYAHPFDPAVGHATITTDSVRLLLVRQEDLRAPETAVAIGAHVGRPGTIELRTANVGAEKSYAALYRAFLREMRPPPDAIERVCASRVVQHFYSPAEIDALRARWS